MQKVAIKNATENLNICKQPRARESMEERILQA